MRITSVSEESMGKSKTLSAEAIEKLPRSLIAKLISGEDQTSNLTEVLAIQMELDDEQLAEWREKRQEINT